MSIIGALIVAFIVGLLGDKIINPLIESWISQDYQAAHPKVAPAIEFAISGVLGAGIAYVLGANMLVNVEGLNVTPLGGIVITGLVAGFGSGAVNAVGQFGGAVKTLVVSQATIQKGRAENVQVQLRLIDTLGARKPSA